jgi:hypothetical protein
MPSNTKSTRSLGAGSSGRTHHLAAGLCCSASRCHASSGSRSRRRRDRGHSARRRPSDRCAHIPGRPQGGAQQPLSEDSRRPPPQSNRCSAQSCARSPKAVSTGPIIPAHYRVRHDKIDSGGSVTVRHNSRLGTVTQTDTHRAASMSFACDAVIVAIALCFGFVQRTADFEACYWIATTSGLVLRARPRNASA